MITQPNLEACRHGTGSSQWEEMLLVAIAGAGADIVVASEQQSQIHVCQAHL